MTRRGMPLEDGRLWMTEEIRKTEASRLSFNF